VRLAKLVAASIQASWIDDPTKLPVATKCKTAELAEIDPACAAPVTSDRLPSVPALALQQRNQPPKGRMLR